MPTSAPCRRATLACLSCLPDGSGGSTGMSNRTRQLLFPPRALEGQPPCRRRDLFEHSSGFAVQQVARPVVGHENPHIPMPRHLHGLSGGHLAPPGLDDEAGTQRVRRETSLESCEFCSSHDDLANRSRCQGFIENLTGLQDALEDWSQPYQGGDRRGRRRSHTQRQSLPVEFLRRTVASPFRWRSGSITAQNLQNDQRMSYSRTAKPWQACLEHAGQGKR